MSRHDPAVVLRQILDHAEEILNVIESAETRRLADNRLLEPAILRLLEMMGEAATRLPAEVVDNYPQIPWRQMIGLRNRLIHGYDAVDLEIVEQIVRQDLPELIENLRVILG